MAEQHPNPFLAASAALAWLMKYWGGGGGNKAAAEIGMKGNVI